MPGNLKPIQTIDGKDIYHVDGMSHIYVETGTEVTGIFVPPQRTNARIEHTVRNDEEGIPHIDEIRDRFSLDDQWDCILSLGIDRRTLRTCRAIGKDDENNAVYLSISHGGKAVISQTKAVELAHYLIDNATDADNIVFNADIPFKVSPETIAVTSLISSHDYVITAQDITCKGYSRATANAALKSMVKRGMLQQCGKRGRLIAYTGTCDRTIFEKYLFGGVQA